MHFVFIPKKQLFLAAAFGLGCELGMLGLDYPKPRRDKSPIRVFVLNIMQRLIADVFDVSNLVKRFE